MPESLRGINGLMRENDTNLLLKVPATKGNKWVVHWMGAGIGCYGLVLLN